MKHKMVGDTAAITAGFTHVNVGLLVRQKGLHDGKHEDDELDTFVLDEDKVCDDLEDQMCEGGNIVDFHTCDFFPERWFDLVVVLRTDNDVLYPRLEARGYSQKKVQENVECEIMCVVSEDARESYKPEILWELQVCAIVCLCAYDLCCIVVRVTAFCELLCSYLGVCEHFVAGE